MFFLWEPRSVCETLEGKWGNRGNRPITPWLRPGERQGNRAAPPACPVFRTKGCCMCDSGWSRRPSLRSSRAQGGGGGSRKEAAESRVKKWERPKVPGGALSWHYFWATGKSHA